MPKAETTPEKRGPGRPRKGVFVELPGELNAELDPAANDRPEDDERANAGLDEDLANMPGDKKPIAEIFRTGDGPEDEYVADIAPGNCTHTYLQKNFGGGRYRCKVWRVVKRKKGGQSLEHARTMMIVIDQTLPRRVPPWLVQAPPAPASHSAAVIDPRREKLALDELEDMNRANREARELNSGMHNATMQMMITAMKSVSESTNRTAPAIDPMQLVRELRQEMREEMQEMLALQRRPEREKDPLDQIVKTLQTKMLLRELKDLETEGDDKESPFSEIAKGLGGALVKWLEGDGSDEPAPVDEPPAELEPADAAAAETAAKPTAPAKPAAVTPEKSPMWAKLLLASMASAIKRKMKPAEYAVSMLDMLPEQFHQQLYTEVSNPGYADRLIAVEKSLEPHKKWIDSVGKEIKKQFDAPR